MASEDEALASASLHWPVGPLAGLLPSLALRSTRWPLCPFQLKELWFRALAKGIAHLGQGLLATVRGGHRPTDTPEAEGITQGHTHPSRGQEAHSPDNSYSLRKQSGEMEGNDPDIYCLSGGRVSVWEDEESSRDKWW